MITSLMNNKHGLIMGVANEKSLAWIIAEQLSNAGAKLAFTYYGESLKKRILPLSKKVKSNIILPCDVTSDEDIKNTFNIIKSNWQRLDFVVHAIAFSDKQELKGKYMMTSRKNFAQTLNISCYSFTSIARYASELMSDGGSLLTLTYYGSEKVIPNYNVMGVAKAALEASVRYLSEDLGPKNIRVNSLSTGPMRTLASSGISDFHQILKWNKLNTPLRRNVSLKDISGASLYLVSPLSSGVTGENHHVDCGYHVVGMKTIDDPEINNLK